MWKDYKICSQIKLMYVLAPLRVMLYFVVDGLDYVEKYHTKKDSLKITLYIPLSRVFEKLYYLISI